MHCREWEWGVCRKMTNAPDGDGDAHDHGVRERHPAAGSETRLLCWSWDAWVLSRRLFGGVEGGSNGFVNVV